MVSDITVTSQLASAQTTQASTVGLADDFSQFLKLLTVQLQNQDPLSPMDSNEFTSQLVQFTQVEQAINTNTKLDDLVLLQIDNATTAALGFIGKEVQYVSSDLPLTEGVPATIRYSLDSDASVAQINIFDEEGNLVQSVPAEKTAGVHEFIWDGKDLVTQDLPTGTYTISIDAIDASDDAVETTVVVQSLVKGIEQQNGIVYALVGDRAIPTTSIINVIDPSLGTST